MIKRLLLILGVMLAIHSLAFSQGTGSIVGTVKDRETGEPVSFANVAIFKEGTLITGSTSEYDGKYAIRAISPGTYELRISFIGYQTQQITGITVSVDKIVLRDVSLNPTEGTLAEAEIFGHIVPIFDPDQTSSGAVVTAQEISNMPNRSATSVVTSVSGVFSKDGEVGSIRGAREGSEAVYLDGMRVNSMAGIPPSAYEQVSVALSGVSAQYGDLTSGVISITTKGATRTLGGSLEVETSQFLDPYGYNRAGLGLTGPLWVKTNAEGVSRPIMGFAFNGDFTYNEDGSYSAVGYPRVNDATLQYLKDNPLRSGAAESGGTYTNVSYILTDANNPDRAINNYKNSKNTSNYRANALGRITFAPTQNIDVAIGGTFSYLKLRDASWSNSMMNWENNGLVTQNTYRAFGRLTQRFPNKEGSAAFVKNFYYSIQADYERTNTSYRDERFEDNIFNYGYLGKYDISMRPSFELKQLDTVGPQPVQVQNGFEEYEVIFTPSDLNTPLANYTSYFTNQGQAPFRNLDALSLAGGLLNGQTPSYAYSLWAPPGTPYNRYSKAASDRWTINAVGSMDIGGHQVRLGFGYEQRNQSSWATSPVGLWQLMRDETNYHLNSLDVENPLYNGIDIADADTIYYNRIVGTDQRTFDYNLRLALGLPVDGTDYIYIDSYNIDTKEFKYYDQNNNPQVAKLGDNVLDISMFEPDELLHGGSGSYISYAGYTYDGQKLNSNPTLEDFFTKQVTVNGRTFFSREIAPYSPTYISGWIEDKFTFNNDIIFQLGLRVDGFDANQQVLKDNYLLYDAYNAKHARDKGITVPENIGDDFVVYGSTTSDDSQVTGYRNGNTWYTADGLETSNPLDLDGSGVKPWLKDPEAAQNQKPTIDAFEDYKTQVQVMPRISFSFPISDEALFFAHYDILTRRPSNVQMNPLNYLNFQQMSVGSTLNNPSLKPTQTIDYELGFKQKVTNNSALSISAFYKEVRNEVQMYRYSGAYPNDYSSYNNIDFGTIKGITIDYDLRRTKNVRLRAGYTLQFATGTGSNPTTQAGLIAAQLPNLRTVIPLDYDQRHAFNIVVDYRFSDGKNYNGPVVDRSKKGKDPIQVLANAGLGVTFRGGSGTPYTRQTNTTSIIRGGTQLLTGTLNGSRLPWQFSIDAKIDKEFYFSMGKKKNSNEKREGAINVYLSCLNILNSKNVMGVYAKTGLPDDDGYLSAPEWQSEIESQLDPETYQFMYEQYINMPGNYSTPRTLHLGVIFSFF